MTVTMNIPSQLPALTGNSLLYLRVNLAENGIEWAATAGGGITINSTAISSGTVNRILFEGAGNVVQQDAGFVWNNTDKRLILGADQASVSTNPRLVVVGKNPSGTTVLAAFHNSTGNSNNLVLLDNGNVGIQTNNPLTPLQIGSSTLNVITLNNVGGAAFDTRQDFNGRLQITMQNQTTTGANTAAMFGGRAGDSQIAIGTTNEAYTGAGTNQYLGNEPRSGVIINKVSSNNPSKLKFILTNTTNAAINRFEWISGTTTAGTFTNGTTATPIMTLIGNGILLLGTTAEVASSILTLASTTKGFLPPRNADPATNIATPVEGLIAFNTTNKKLQVYDGTNWIDLH